MKIQYVSDDGHKFETEKECLEHENKNAIKDKRKAEVDKAYEEYLKLLDKYVEDYGEYYHVNKSDWEHSPELSYLRNLFKI